MRKPNPPTLEDHPELSVLALLHETLQLAELSLIATDRRIVDHEPPFPLDDPVAHLAQVILGQSVALQATLDAYEKALDCHDDANDSFSPRYQRSDLCE